MGQNATPAVTPPSSPSAAAEEAKKGETAASTPASTPANKPMEEMIASVDVARAKVDQRNAERSKKALDAILLDNYYQVDPNNRSINKGQVGKAVRKNKQVTLEFEPGELASFAATSLIPADPPKNASARTTLQPSPSFKPTGDASPSSKTKDSSDEEGEQEDGFDGSWKTPTKLFEKKFVPDRLAPSFARPARPALAPVRPDPVHKVSKLRL